MAVQLNKTKKWPKFFYMYNSENNSLVSGFHEMEKFVKRDLFFSCGNQPYFHRNWIF